jgi:hypothetical protein
MLNDQAVDVMGVDVMVHGGLLWRVNAEEETKRQRWKRSCHPPADPLEERVGLIRQAGISCALTEATGDGHCCAL